MYFLEMSVKVIEEFIRRIALAGWIRHPHKYDLEDVRQYGLPLSFIRMPYQTAEYKLITKRDEQAIEIISPGGNTMIDFDLKNFMIFKLDNESTGAIGKSPFLPYVLSFPRTLNLLAFQLYCKIPVSFSSCAACDTAKAASKDCHPIYYITPNMSLDDFIHVFMPVITSPGRMMKTFFDAVDKTNLSIIKRDIEEEYEKAFSSVDVLKLRDFLIDYAYDISIHGPSNIKDMQSDLKNKIPIILHIGRMAAYRELAIGIYSLVFSQDQRKKNIKEMTHTDMIVAVMKIMQKKSIRPILSTYII